jgi:uncharacterized protein YjbJ (UPF0337 family)
MPRIHSGRRGYPYPVTNQTEDTAGGVLGRVAGKAKAVAGTALGNEELAREGRLQEAQSDAEREAGRRHAEALQAEEEADTARRRTELMHERERLHRELAAEEREAAIEHDRELAWADAERDAARERDAAGGVRAAGEQAAVEAEREAALLDEQAGRAEARADAVDPEQGR